MQIIEKHTFFNDACPVLDLETYVPATYETEFASKLVSSDHVPTIIIVLTRHQMTNLAYCIDAKAAHKHEMQVV